VVEGDVDIEEAQLAGIEELTDPCWIGFESMTGDLHVLHLEDRPGIVAAWIHERRDRLVMAAQELPLVRTPGQEGHRPVVLQDGSHRELLTVRKGDVAVMVVAHDRRREPAQHRARRHLIASSCVAQGKALTFHGAFGLGGRKPLLLLGERESMARHGWTSW